MTIFVSVILFPTVLLFLLSYYLGASSARVTYGTSNDILIIKYSAIEEAIIACTDPGTNNPN